MRSFLTFRTLLVFTAGLVLGHFSVRPHFTLHNSTSFGRPVIIRLDTRSGKCSVIREHLAHVSDIDEDTVLTQIHEWLIPSHSAAPKPNPRAEPLSFDDLMTNTP
jgi:hypothetical protein